MSRIVKPLSASQVKNAKPSEKLYKLSDGGGLALWVYPSGTKAWRLSYRDSSKKQQTVSLGRFPDFSLVEAREWREEIRRKIAHGEMKSPKKPYPLNFVARQWYDRWQPDMAAKYAEQTWRNLERWIFVRLGETDVTEITTADIVECLRIMEARGIRDTLRKTKNSLGLVFDFAVGSGLIPFNPVRQISNRIFVRAKSKNMAALPPSDLPRLIDFLEQRGEFANPTNRTRLTQPTRLAIYWLLLTMTRVQETCMAKWSEIDGGIWTIPADRKKERREHLVPLSSALQQILQQAKTINMSGVYLFESSDFVSHLNKESPRAALRSAGLNTTAHGLRSLARTYLREELKVADDVAEKLLAHSLGTKTQTAYNRSELLKERTEALERWGNVVLTLIGDSSVFKNSLNTEHL